MPAVTDLGSVIEAFIGTGADGFSIGAAVPELVFPEAVALAVAVLSDEVSVAVAVPAESSSDTVLPFDWSDDTELSELSSAPVATGS